MFFLDTSWDEIPFGYERAYEYTSHGQIYNKELVERFLLYEKREPSQIEII